MWRQSTGLALALWFAVAAAQEFPDRAVVRNLQAAGFDIVELDCKRTRPNQIDCELVQVRVSRRLDPEKADAEAARIWKAMSPAQIASERKGLTEACREFQSADIKRQPGQSAEDLRYAKEQLDAILAFCKDPTDESMRQLLVRSKRQEAQQCAVTSNPFKQSFSWQSNTGRWLTNYNVQGLCGVVQVWTLHSEKDKHGGTIWIYEGRKTVTNKSGPGCDMLDESPQSYRTSYNEKVLNCKTIQWGL